MQVFLSWSGDKGRDVANALKDWLPLVLQAVRPWMSKGDISAGSQWLVELSEALAGSQAGIVCVTEESLLEPWLLFESGALLKAVDKPFVCPYLIDLPAEKLSGPLAQFQGISANRDGTWQLLSTLNNRLPEGSRIEGRIISKSFNTFWKQLEEQITLANSKDRKPHARPPTKTDKILAGVRDLARNQESLMKKIDQVSGLRSTRPARLDNPLVSGNPLLPGFNPYEHDWMKKLAEGSPSSIISGGGTEDLREQIRTALGLTDPKDPKNE